MEQNPLIDKLNVVLSDLHVFYQKLRNFHWNVTGSDFYELHKMFESQYDTIYDPTEEEFRRAIEKSLLCKSKNWSYEEEYRITSKSNE